MKKVLLIAFVILTGCANNATEKPNEVNKTLSLPETIELKEIVERTPISEAVIDNIEWMSLNETNLDNLRINDGVTASSELIESNGKNLLVKVLMRQSGEFETYIIIHEHEIEFDKNSSVVFYGLYAGTDNSTDYLSYTAYCLKADKLKPLVLRGFML